MESERASGFWLESGVASHRRTGETAGDAVVSDRPTRP